MIFIEDEDIVLDNEKEWINDNIFKPTNNSFFPWFLQQNQVGVDGNPFFSHIIKDPKDPKVKSFVTPIFITMVARFAHKHKLPCSRVLRSCLNLTFHIKEPTVKHTDFDDDEDYFQTILYLNDGGGDTIIYDKEDTSKEIKRIKPKKWKMICFGNHYHKAETPEAGYRVAFVTVFK